MEPRDHDASPAGEVIGRFAPSPTGPLHRGSVVAALGSFLSARSQGGRWLVRIDDLDPPRAVAGSADTILRQLEALALHWDDEVLYQGSRSEAYAEAVAELQAAGLLFRCTCGRKLLKRTAPFGVDGTVYPGTCREQDRDAAERHALRMRIGEGEHGFEDRWRGQQRADRATDLGDFIVQRSDGLYAYPLAAALDDAHQGITEVVRGADLLPSTHRQRMVLDALGLPAPDYGHLPMILDATGEKLSKSEGAAALDADAPTAVLLDALVTLGQPVPDGAGDAAPETLLEAAVAAWDPALVPVDDRHI